jgi:hypothetical protein
MLGMSLTSVLNHVGRNFSDPSWAEGYFTFNFLLVLLVLFFGKLREESLSVLIHLVKVLLDF